MLGSACVPTALAVVHVERASKKSARVTAYCLRPYNVREGERPDSASAITLASLETPICLHNYLARTAQLWSPVLNALNLWSHAESAHRLANASEGMKVHCD